MIDWLLLVGVVVTILVICRLMPDDVLPHKPIGDESNGPIPRDDRAQDYSHNHC